MIHDLFFCGVTKCIDLDIEHMVISTYMSTIYRPLNTPFRTKYAYANDKEIK